MKKDKLLQHQLKRLDRMLKDRMIDFSNPLSADKIWIERFEIIYHNAILRSITRWRASL